MDAYYMKRKYTKRPTPDYKSFRRSVMKLTSLTDDYDYDLWCAGFNYAMKKYWELNKKEKL